MSMAQLTINRLGSDPSSDLNMKVASHLANAHYMPYGEEELKLKLDSLP